MASLLRQIVAGPRARHPEAGLDLCYVTSDIIATSGPSGTYPQRAYRNPLDQLVAFLDSKHKGDWAIWEFRAEGTGYPDEEVYGRIRHYPWPDHHPPPFRLIPMIMASMRNWLNGGELEGGDMAVGAVHNADNKKDDKTKNPRVVVVHCKAGKGRSGTISCSYLISECGWRPEEALTRFTERRMRPKFGAGVSIPSQLRWITYVDRWTKGGKKYVDREIEIVEIHAWGLRNGVKVDVEGFEEEGKRIKVFHTFKREERVVVEGNAPDGGGVTHMVYDFAGYGLKYKDDAPPEADLADSANADNEDGKVIKGNNASDPTLASSVPSRSTSKKLRNAKTTTLIRESSSSASMGKLGRQAAAHSTSAASSNSQLAAQVKDASASGEAEPGGMAVILKPAQPIRIPNSDVNISVERRNKTSVSMGMTMVTAVAHVWFNTFFEGNGPEQDGTPDASGIFEIEWDAMDGIKGSSRKGSRAFDRIAVVWRAVGSTRAEDGGDRVEADKEGEEVAEPSEGSPVPQMKPANWKGDNKEDPERERVLGLRLERPHSADISKASSVKSQDRASDDANDETDSMAGVRVSGPGGEEELDAGEVDVGKLHQPKAVNDEEAGDPAELAKNPDTASGTTALGSTEIKR